MLTYGNFIFKTAGDEENTKDVKKVICKKDIFDVLYNIHNLQLNHSDYASRFEENEVCKYSTICCSMFYNILHNMRFKTTPIYSCTTETHFIKWILGKNTGISFLVIKYEVYIIINPLNYGVYIL